MENACCFLFSPEPAWCWAHSTFSKVLVELSQQRSFQSRRHCPVTKPPLQLHPGSHLAFLIVFFWNFKALDELYQIAFWEDYKTLHPTRNEDHFYLTLNNHKYLHFFLLLRN